MESLYNVCRLAYLCCQEGVPWHMMVHAIREGVESPFKTYRLQEKDYVQYPILREFVEATKNCPNINEVEKWIADAPSEASTPLLVGLMIKKQVRWPQ